MSTVVSSTHAPAILAALQAHPEGLTDGEIAEATGLTAQVASYHRRKLQRAGLITYCGCRHIAGVNTPPTVWRCANG
jgi:DNA-binding transcriptional ArsR family regulator